MGVARKMIVDASRLDDTARMIGNHERALAKAALRLGAKAAGVPGSL